MSVFFTKLHDLKPDCRGNTNVIGVAHSVSSPISTRGTDHLCRLSIIDNSTTIIINCMIFGCKDILPRKNLIPEPSIVRLSSVKVQYFAGRPQINKSNDYSFSFFHPYDDSFTPLDQSRIYNGELTEEEKQSINELRDWLISPEFSSTNFGIDFTKKDPIVIARNMSAQASDQHAKRLKTAVEQAGANWEQSDLEAAADFDLITNHRPTHRFNKFMDFPIPLQEVSLNLYCNLNVQVIGVGDCHKNFILRCCDGTISSVNMLKISPLHIRSNLSQHVLLQLDQYTVDISIFDDHILIAKTVHPGDFISLTNVHCYIPFGLSIPELVLHGGKLYNRGLKKLTPDCKTAKLLQSKIDEIPIEAAEVTEIRPLPGDDPRSVQTSPTECLYPEQNLSTLAQIVKKPTDKGLYKVRVYVHNYEPDSYASMIQITCEKCSAVKNIDQELCSKCNGPDFVKTLYFKLHVQDGSVSEPLYILCFGGQARDLVGVDRVDTSADLVPLEHTVYKWCDLHVLCKVVSDNNVKLILAHTIIKVKS